MRLMRLMEWLEHKILCRNKQLLVAKKYSVEEIQQKHPSDGDPLYVVTTYNKHTCIECGYSFKVISKKATFTNNALKKMYIAVSKNIGYTRDI